jgi:osmotically-inducible protein OsmY
MYKQFRKLAIASGVALATIGTSGAFAADSMCPDMTAVRQEVQISTTYALSPYLRTNALKVSVQNGEATLTGDVEESVEKDLAKQIALGVDGIKSVDNQIQVKSDYVAAKGSSDRSFGDKIDDATITAGIKSKLLWSKHTDGLTTEVDTTSGKVTLVGTTDSAAAKELAGRLAMNTHGVVSVDNQLVVKDTKAAAVEPVKGATPDVGQAMSDDWITTKVKSSYMYSSNVESSDISVSTRNGVVTLSGKVNSGVESALAIEIAENIRGVKSVESKNLTF